MTEKGTIKTIKREPVFNTVVCFPWWWDNIDLDCNIGEKLCVYRVRSCNEVDSMMLSLWIC